MTVRIEYASRGREFADRREGEAELVRTTVNGRSELLPSDPIAVAKILKERRIKSPAEKARARMAAEAKRRGH